MADKQVTVRSASGKAELVPQSKLAEFIESGGEPITKAEYRAAQLEAKYGGAAGTLAAAGAGAGRGLTFGLSDQIATAIGGEETRQDLAALQEYNPNASIAGEIGGALLPMLLPGGQAAEAGALARLGRAATVGPRAVSALGGLAERGVVGLLGEGATATGRIGRAALKTAAGGATEGLFYGAGQEISDAAIHNHDLTAEKLLAAAGKGALLGAAFGGATGGGFSALGEAGRAALGRLGRAEAKVAQAAEREAVEAAEKVSIKKTVKEVLEETQESTTKTTSKTHFGEESVDDMLQRVAKKGESEGFGDIFNAIKEGIEPKSMWRDAVGMREGESASQFLQRFKNEKAWKAAGGTQNLAAMAEKYGGGYDKIASHWFEEAPGLVGKKSFQNMNRESMVEAAKLGKKKYGGLLEDALVGAEKKGAGVTVGDIADILDNEIASARGRLGQQNVASRLEADKKMLLMNHGVLGADGKIVPEMLQQRIGLKDAQRYRRDFDATAFGTKKTPELTKVGEAYSRARDALEKHIIEQGAQHGGTEWVKQYAKAKKGWQAFDYLDKAASKGVSREAANRSFGLSEQIGGGVGSAIGSVFGGPVGTVIGGAVGAGLSNVVRTRGDFIAAEMADKLSRLASIEKVAGFVDAKIDAGIEGFLKGRPSRTQETESTTFTRTRKAAASDESFVKQAARTAGAATRNSSTRMTLQQQEDMSRGLAGMRNNPTAQMNAAQRVMGTKLTEAAPNIAASMATRMASMLALSSQKAPSFKGSANFGGPDFSRPNPADIMRLANYYEGVYSPLSIFDDMKEGKLSRTKAQAVRENYPKLWEDIQTKMIDRVASGNAKLGYDQRIQASIMFGVPLDATMQPEVMRAIQASKSTQAPEEGEQGGGAPQRGGSSVELNKSLATASASIEQGVD